jgi:pyruvate dehydrogenase E1 component beta subunit
MALKFSIFAPQQVRQSMARELTLRDAIREAMSEEMRRDDSVFLMGEEVAEYNGAYKVSKGMLDEFGPRGH